jgi:hypothetical protein
LKRRSQESFDPFGFGGNIDPFGFADEMPRRKKNKRRSEDDYMGNAFNFIGNVGGMAIAGVTTVAVVNALSGMLDNK